MRNVLLHDIAAVLPRSREPERRDPAGIDTIAFHCTGVPAWNVWDVARYHTGPNHISLDGCPTICYAYFVEPDGLSYRCLPLETRAWHAGPWNGRAVGVCVASGGLVPLPEARRRAAVEICAHLAALLSIGADRVLGHRELEGSGFVVENGETIVRKECPGRAIDLEVFRRHVAAALAREGGPAVREVR